MPDLYWTSARIAVGALLLSGCVTAAGEAADVSSVGRAAAPPAVSPAAVSPAAVSPAALPVSPAAGPTPPTTDLLVAQARARDGATALAVLGSLTVQGRAPRTGYDRALFGQRWADTDRNGCDTRNDILGRDLTATIFKAGTRDCVVLTGRLADPLTGRAIAFDRSAADEVHVDHVVALSDAWQKGAQSWPAGKRLAFANDPLNLLAVDGPANMSKGDGDAATWLPPNKSFRCPMVARQVAVKAKYGLWVVPAEREAIARVLGGCPGQDVPAGGNPTMAPAQPAAPAAPAQQPARTAAPAPSANQAGAKAYANCTELRRDYRGGVARQGATNQGGATRHTPHYDDALYQANSKSDRDGDGIACEN
ncbi:MAG: DUF1524 domain-containing protein [Mycobacteriales bacterium]